ncbi:MAG: translation initiation factor IF-2 subunit gamma [Candidatus Woesearchaeota archaeon]
MSKKNPIVEGQPEINLGLVGHVDHGKTTLTRALSGIWTDTHSEEVKRGITIRLGYADSIIRKTADGHLTVAEKDGFGVETEPVRKISLVDAPGHESLMATMLAGVTIMDGALLLVSATEECPQPQTMEHLQALEISGIDKIIVVQNKVDLVSPEDAKKNYDEIKAFLSNTKFKDSPIIPIAAKHNLNIDMLLETIQSYFPTPKRDDKGDPVLMVARTFDINKPGVLPQDLKGGVLGGSLKQGHLKIGDAIEITPGRIVIEKNQFVNYPLKANVVGIMTGGKPVKEIVAGGSVAVLTDLDPSIVKSDSLRGNLVTLPGKAHPVWKQLDLKVTLLDRVLGSKEHEKVNPIAKNEQLLLNVNSAATVGLVSDIKKGVAHCILKIPICADVGQKVTISRQIGSRFRLVGFGEIVEK